MKSVSIVRKRDGPSTAHNPVVSSPSERSEGLTLKKRKVKRHGFQTPFHPLQVVSWVLFLMNTGIFIFLVLPNSLSNYIFLPFATLAVPVVVLTILATRSDPSEKACPGAGSCICEVCEQEVSAGAKHCGLCN